ncbi:MAG: pyridoxamine 5'-phosphate oxidase family protein [Dehalococcoidia bacterium]|nr:pyridoxamine 5'-phosphate oxidase family protein [Dehalococcoidia bacterium]
MAVSLTPEMQQAINNAFVDGYPIIWASAGADGQPVLGFFGTTQAYSDHEIGVWMRTPERGFLARIAENPKATMLYRNTETRASFQIHVEAKRVDDEAVKQTVWSNAAEREREQDPEMKGTAVVAEIVRVIQRGEILMQRD